LIEIDKSEGADDPATWRVKVRSLGGGEGERVSDQPEYEVNPEPLGRCPLEEDCQIVESPTQFVCERKLKQEELGRDETQPRSCGFVLPRSVCRREITRDEALVYVRTGKTDLLTDFTSRFGRPFSAILVLKENGRHGFEFPPRGAKAEAAETSGEADPARGPAGGGRVRKASRRQPAATAGAQLAARARKQTAARSGDRRRAARPRKAAPEGSQDEGAPAREVRGWPSARFSVEFRATPGL
jgi:hypothetical protein